ncbi:MAG: hypothetical protein AAFQ57_07775 [Cyanobacteria bacterium J06626_14]
MHSALSAFQQHSWYQRTLQLSTAVASMMLSLVASTTTSSVAYESASLLRPEIALGSEVAIASPSTTSSTDVDLLNSGVQAQSSVVPALEDGIYLYGQSPAPEQLGTAYLVFEVSSDSVVGAFYMPHSSFDCFSGEFRANQLALQIVDSYEQVTFPYSIALENDSVLASSGDVTSAEIELAGFHQIEAVSDNDHRILDVCKADLLDEDSL